MNKQENTIFFLLTKSVPSFPIQEFVSHLDKSVFPSEVSRP